MKTSQRTVILTPIFLIIACLVLPLTSCTKHAATYEFKITGEDSTLVRYTVRPLPLVSWDEEFYAKNGETYIFHVAVGDTATINCKSYYSVVYMTLYMNNEVRTTTTFPGDNGSRTKGYVVEADNYKLIY